MHERIRVYAITPTRWIEPATFDAGIRAAVRGGVTAVQLRWKHDDRTRLRACAEAACAAARDGGALFIVNDDPALALAVGADGVHLGPHDRPVADVRNEVADGLIIGGSAGTPETALGLVNDGADYLGVGAIYDASGSKPDASGPRGPGVLARIREHSTLASVPIVAIGGIDLPRAAACISAGADGVAVIRAVFGDDDPAAIESAARALRAEVDTAVEAACT